MNDNEKFNGMHPGARQLERVAFEVGAATTEIRLAEEHLETCGDCAMQVETLRAEREAFLKRVPPNVFFASLGERTELTKVRPSLSARFYLTRRSLLAVVAAFVPVGLVAVLTLFENGEERSPGEAYPGISLKGQTMEAVGLTLFVSRDGREAVPWVKNSPLHSGDVIKFGVRSQSAGYVTVVDIDDRGTVSIYYPTQNGATSRIEEGKMTVLSGSIVLDDFVGEELLVVFVTPKPGDVKMLGDAVRSAYRRSGNTLDGLGFENVDAVNGTLKIRKVKP